MVSYMLYIFQPGLNSTRWESNLTELPQTLCIRESAMPLNIHNASFATEITGRSTSKTSGGGRELEDSDIP